jgi:nucleoside-diphosphate-sugar epimerase
MPSTPNTTPARPRAHSAILVTGATGQVGRRLVPRLLGWREPNERIRVLVRTQEAADRFAALGAEAVVGDLRETEDRKRALDGVGVVVNSAATFRTPGLTADDMYSVNRDAAVALATESAAAGVERFVQISTNLVYGPGVGRPHREDDELRAEGGYPYAQTKREAEEGIAQVRALDVVTLRLAFVYGEGDPHIVDWLPRAAAPLGGAPDTSADGAHTRHSDVAQAVIRAIRTPGIAGRVYNVGDDAALTAVELFALTGREFDLEAAAGRSVEDPWLGVPDTRLAHRELGYRPVIPAAVRATLPGAGAPRRGWCPRPVARGVDPGRVGQPPEDLGDDPGVQRRRRGSEFHPRSLIHTEGSARQGRFKTATFRSVRAVT